MLISACSKPPSRPITIAINPWPGYEFLYLAEQKGFFQEVGLNVQLIQLGSLADAQRAYINGRADGLTSTLIEAVQAEPLGGKPLTITLVPDYSNGGDVIIASSEIKDITALKGKTVGCEVTSLGIYVLQRALSKAGLSLDDVNVVNTEQSGGERAILDKTIDAFVSYPPESINILKNKGYHIVFSSAEIPFEIIDTLSISSEVIMKTPGLIKKLHKVWDLALEFSKANPDEAYQIMAEREGISAEEFKAALSDLVVLDRKEQQKLFAQPDKLESAAMSVCKTLVKVKSLNSDCAYLSGIVYRGEI